jgi:hypothetical protein
MGRTYAGVLGLLACGIILARGLVTGGGAEGTLLAASGGLFLFAGLGYLAGQTAEMLVRDSVRSQFQSALTAWQQQQHRKTQNKPNA